MSGLNLSGQASIARRLAGFSIIFVTATVIVASVILYLIVAGVVREQIDQRLDTQIEGLRNALTTDSAGDVVLSADLDGPPFDRPRSGWYWQVSEDRTRITSRSLAEETLESPPRPFDWRHAARPKPQPADRIAFRDETLYLRTLETMVGDRTVEIIASAPQSSLSAPAGRALLWLVPAMLLLGGVLVGGILLQVRYGLRPLRQLTSDIASISAGALPRLPDQDVEELQPASREINRLVDKNAERLAETRLHFANLAHGLKTPVASLQLALNGANDPTNEMRDLVDRIDQRIRHHLARARKTASSGTVSATQVNPRIDDLVLVMSRIHADRGISVQCTIEPQISVACAAEDFDEIVGNLLDNAFKWAGSLVAIDARTDGRSIVITLEDDGPGISDDTIEKAFLPGVRMDETVAGDGFGLTIANELAQLYGGKIALRNQDDKGLRQTITLPKTAAGSSPVPA
ncbi:sensor histidine kinase [Neorhizobium sp. DAR64872/K0K18]|uniref:sensor histidine kinase n=1 Tax=Neorhizobium sp. DAR64872/K0K18 TaxID=3421958 RepID=UPI003D29513D